jgi:uncharacterized protein (DUF433 family)
MIANGRATTYYKGGMRALYSGSREKAMADQKARGEALDPYRTGRAYTITEAARLADTSYQNVRRWVKGYSRPGHHMEPVFGDKSFLERSDEPLMISFLDLLEIVVAARFRKADTGRKPVSLERIRLAHDYAEKQLGVRYPFAHLRLRQEGGHILHEFDEASPGRGLLVLSSGGQWVLPDVVLEEYDDIDFDGDYAEKWYPFGRRIPIVVNPRIAAGALTFDGTGVTVETVHGRFKAGATIDHLARDYSLNPSAVERALQYAA